jgi:hypothetical protein
MFPVPSGELHVSKGKPFLLDSRYIALSLLWLFEARSNLLDVTRSDPEGPWLAIRFSGPKEIFLKCYTSVVHVTLVSTPDARNVTHAR